MTDAVVTQMWSLTCAFHYSLDDFMLHACQASDANEHTVKTEKLEKMAINDAASLTASRRDVIVNLKSRRELRETSTMYQFLDSSFIRKSHIPNSAHAFSNLAHFPTRGKV